MTSVDVKIHVNFARVITAKSDMVSTRIANEVWLAARAAGINKPDISVSCAWRGRQCEIAVSAKGTGAVPFPCDNLNAAMVVCDDVVEYEEGV